MSLFGNNNRGRQMSRQQQQRQSNAPWEGYARQDDREQGWYCTHDHDDYGCDE